MVDITGGDLYSLWKIANVALPRVANVYTDAIPSVSSTESAAQSAFDGAGQGTYGSTMGNVYPAFCNLRNEFWHVLSGTATNLMDCSSAINKAIEDYKAQDSGAATDFENIMQGKEVDGVQLHDPSDPTQNPPTGGDAPDRDDIDSPEYYESAGDKKEGE
jgi:hypothetical protein